MSLHDLKLAILKGLSHLDAGQQMHRSSLLGLPYSKGHVELELQRQFSKQERELASRAFDELVASGLIERTYTDPNAPEYWVRLSPAGIAALSSGLFDDLDRALASISAFAAPRDGGLPGRARPYRGARFLALN